MNKLKYIYALALALFLFPSCQDELLVDNKTKQVEVKEKVDEIPYIPGQAYVKMVKGGDDFVDKAVQSSIKMFNTLTKSSSIRVERVFDLGGKYGPALKREGLDRWYKVYFEPELKVEDVVKELSKERKIEIAHGGLKVIQTKYTYTPCPEAQTRWGNQGYPDVNHGYNKFQHTDPLLKKQWHYQNDGMQPGFSYGSDINLFKAWDKTTGDKRVVVAIIDSGIDVEHPDLAGSMWTDEEGHHGKNFLHDTYIISTGFHGTHVGGTIGARNNNDLGVAGIAGGDGTSESGVRLMSCQIFGPDEKDGSAQSATPDQIAKAFVWAAENGAVVANCSWGYPWIEEEQVNAENYKQIYAKSSKIIQESMEFFVKYAGNDKDGNQEPNSLMSGGVIFFASGNDGARDIEIIPASSPSVIAVGAFDTEYRVTSYTNTGNWVNILAPGGDVNNNMNKGILSTVPLSFKDIKIGITWGENFLYPGDTYYAYANGTSMATPHVTGIAALMVSFLGKQGFTNKELKKRLLNAVKNKNYEAINNDANLKGKIGVGYVDAEYALMDPEKKAPEKVKDLEAYNVEYYDASLKWKVPVDEDANSKVAFGFKIYLSKEKNSKLDKPYVIVRTFEKQQGELLSYDFKKLESDVEYYVTIKAFDRYDNESDMITTSFTTKLNHAPKFKNPLDIISILNTEPFYRYTYVVEDKDKDQTWDYSTSELPKGVRLERDGNNLTLVIVTGDVPTGSHLVEIYLHDNLGGESVEPVKFAVVEHNSPEVVNKMSDLIISKSDKPVKLNVSEVFISSTKIKDCTYSVSSNDKSIVKVEIDGETLKVIPQEVGSATVILTINDGIKKVSTTFQVQVTKDNESEIVALYPIPAYSYVKVLVHTGVESININVISIRGESLIKKTVKVNSKTSEAMLSVDKLSPGIYNLIVKLGNKTSKRTFIKN